MNIGLGKGNERWMLNITDEGHFKMGVILREGDERWMWITTDEGDIEVEFISMEGELLKRKVILNWDSSYTLHPRPIHPLHFSHW